MQDLIPSPPSVSEISGTVCQHSTYSTCAEDQNIEGKKLKQTMLASSRGFHLFTQVRGKQTIYHEDARDAYLSCWDLLGDSRGREHLNGMVQPAGSSRGREHLNGMVQPAGSSLREIIQSPYLSPSLLYCSTGSRPFVFAV